MDKKEALEQIRTIFEREGLIEYGPDDVVDNEDSPFCTGVFYTRTGPHGGASKALLDLDGLVISGELRDDYEVTRFDLEWIDHDE